MPARSSPARSPGRAWRRRLFLAAVAGLGAAFDIGQAVRRARRGPWRAEVAEASMAPALLPGDWLLLDPTTSRWPRPASIVAVREPATGLLAVKRVAARGPGPVPGRTGRGDEAGSSGRLGPREAWLLGDAADVSVDSRAYGPLDADDLVARAWFRYGPPGRIGRLR